MPDQAWFDMMKRVRAGKPENAYETMLLSEFDKIRALLRHVDLSDVPNQIG
jgi:ribosomal protein L20A (L18A)